MIRTHYKIFFLSLLTAISACENEPIKAPSLGDAKAISSREEKAQDKLETIKIYLGATELNAEIADENHERRSGMMHRTKMGPNEAMLFVFPYPHQTGFWMKNTIIPLSIAYIDQNSRILEIHNLEPGNTNTVDSKSEKIMYALEVNKGWFTKHGIKPGNVIGTDKGSLANSVQAR
tara:strand:- start:54 stop:581 length:528 start_codon:yes stop_codon:yes gene_type:complete